MKTVSSLPANIVDFIDFATNLYIGGNTNFDLLADEFSKLSAQSIATVQKLFLSEISHLITNPHDSAIGWDTNQLLLEVNPHFSLGISILHATPPHLLNAVSNAAYIVIGPAPFEYAMYKLPPHLQREVFDPAIRPTSAGKHVLRPGQTLRISSGVDLIDWHVTTPVILLRLISAPTESIQWTFRKNPIRPWFVASVDPGATQLSALCAYFSAAHDAVAATSIADLRLHRNHQVRWEAAQALWKIDRNLGLDALRERLNDTHPHVRNAAIRTMAKLNQ